MQSLNSPHAASLKIIPGEYRLIVTTQDQERWLSCAFRIMAITLVKPTDCCRALSCV